MGTGPEIADPSGRSAREICFRFQWVVDFDIKGLFDNLITNFL